MSFTKRILLEHSVKYLLLVLIAFFVWGDLKTGLLQMEDQGNLEAIAVIMSVIALASVSGYFAFSYTQVSKGIQRYFGYVCTFFLGLSMMLSLLIVYFVAVIWAPEFAHIWFTIVASLFVGIAFFDNLDLMRMGLDVSATQFFESGNTELFSKDQVVDVAVDFLREGHRLSSANGLIGQAVLELGRQVKDADLKKGGQWILERSDLSQEQVDKKIVELFRPYAEKSSTVRKSITELEKGLSQAAADQMIATMIERVYKEKK